MDGVNQKIAGIALRGAACLLAGLLLTVSAQAAKQESASREPILVTTVGNYRYADATHEMEIAVPKLEQPGEAADSVNREINERTAALAGNFYRDLNGGYGSLFVDYEVVTNTRDWFTLKLSVNEIAADSNQYYLFYHIDRKREKRMELGDLFCTDTYSRVLTAELKRQMQARMDQDENAVYWIQNGEPGKGFQSVRADQNFYWNGDGDLVIVFDQFAVAPGYMGTPEFTVDRKLIQDMLCPGL